MNVTKTKALISYTVTGKLICVFANTKSRFSHNEAQMIGFGGLNLNRLLIWLI